MAQAIYTEQNPQGVHSIVKNMGGLTQKLGVWDFGWEKIFWGSSNMLIWTIVRG